MALMCAQSGSSFTTPADTGSLRQHHDEADNAEHADHTENHGVADVGRVQADLPLIGQELFPGRHFPSQMRHRQSAAALLAIADGGLKILFRTAVETFDECHRRLVWVTDHSRVGRPEKCHAGLSLIEAETKIKR